MKLEIEFENQEDLRKKLSSLLPEPTIPQYKTMLYSRRN